MEMTALRNRIKDTALALGAGDVGFADLSALKSKPCTELIQKYASAVSVVIPLSKGILEEVATEPTITYFAHYRAVNRLIDHITLSVSLLLESEGFKSYAIPASQSVPADDYAGVFPHKTAATLAGLGTIGKNALFMHETFGPAVRLGTVLTTMPAEKNNIHPSICGDCTLCRDHCPAMAIEGVNWEPGLERKSLIDVRACSNHMKEAYQHIGRGVVCGLCITCCPHAHLNLSQGENNETQRI